MAAGRDIEPPLVRRLRKRPLTPQRAALIIGSYTLTVTVAAGIVMRFVDRRDFDSIGAGLWWALQTVTTVGYGDITPENTVGKFIGALVMVSGIGFLTVITASVTAALIESARQRARAQTRDELAERLDAIEARLAELVERR